MGKRLDGTVIVCTAVALGLVFLLAASPAHAQCGMACQVVSAGCSQCVLSPLAGGCIQTGPCTCRRAICAAASGAETPADWLISAAKGREACAQPRAGATAAGGWSAAGSAN